MTNKPFKLKSLLIVLFINITLLSNAQGVNAPEASGFEPVDATDMVNLTNGNFTYVMPLLDVEGFPVSLSYHAGIATDMQASWVGLGWYLNPGAINRSVNGTPDDWKDGVGINFNSYEETIKKFGVSVDIGLPGASVGVGMNWGGGQGMSGSVRAAVGIGKGLLGDMAGAGVSVSANTSGDVTVGAGAGVQLGSFGAGASVSYSLSAQQFTLGVGAGYIVGDSGRTGFENTMLGVGGSMTEGGGFSIGGGTSHFGNKGSSKGSTSGGVGMGSDSFSQGDASVDVQSTAVALPLHFTGIPLTIGFTKTKIKINIKKGFINHEWGTLYSSRFQNSTPLIAGLPAFGGHFWDHVKRTRSLDTYSTRLPESEEDFIGDYSKTIENINFTFINYDNYNVAAQGLIGNLSPRVFQSATIFGKGQRTKNASGQPIHAFWHMGGSQHRIRRTLGRLSGSNNNYSNQDFYFYFDGQFTRTELSNPSTLRLSNLNTSNDLSDLLNQGNHSGIANSGSTRGRTHSPNYVEVFTNRQIQNQHAKSRGLISPSTINDADRVNKAKFDPDGIGAYKVTSPDGKTYHFALPVYHFEKVVRHQINNKESSLFNINNVNEQRQYHRFATHWLLTAITGSDYVDRPDSNGNLGTFNKEDYGYWVELEYGKWSDGFVWRSPYRDFTYDYNTNIESKIESDDKGYYSFGRKQIYYLDKINTRNRTALFVKSIRYDAIGKDLKFKYNNGGRDKLGSSVDHHKVLNRTDAEVFVRETNVNYKREYSLKLDEIILVDGDLGKTLRKNNTIGGHMGGSHTGYVPNDFHRPSWRSEDFRRHYEQPFGTPYSYKMHNESEILGVNDITQTIKDNALKTISFGYSYNLAKNSPSSEDQPTGSPNRIKKGKLTLKTVQVKGRGNNNSYMPPTKFSYYFENGANEVNNVNLPPNGITVSQIQQHIKTKANFVDSWGFLQGTTPNGDNKIKAWSLKDITTPTGAKIEVDYEEDNYWIEAFSRRYWEQGLIFNLYIHNGELLLDVKQNPSTISSDGQLNLKDYFSDNRPVFLDFFYFRNPNKNSCGHRVGDFAGAFEIKNLSALQMTLKLPFPTVNPTRRYEVGKCGEYPWSYTSHLTSGGSCANLIEDMTWVDRQGASTCSWGDNGTRKFMYKILANKVPENETGGGLRVKELRTVDGTNTYKVQYDYNHPTENRSSGITSYAPVDGLKFVPYQSEVPPPGVMYEYVTMKETSNNGDYASKTRYRHHVLKPVFNIFDPNIELEALDANSEGEDRIFWANVKDNYGGFNGTNSKKMEAKRIDVNINTALMGQIKSIENINSQGQIMGRLENEYINGQILSGERPNNNGGYGDSEPNKGYIRESFQSLKSIYRTNDDGNQIYEVKRLLSVSTKTQYTNMLKRSKTYTGGYDNEVTYKDVDPWLGSFRKSITTLADGTKFKSYKVPAYTKYAAMRSKVLKPSYKNMLTQEAMSFTEYNNKTLNVSLTTWKSNWAYRDEQGNMSNSSSEWPVWRKHKTYVWKDNINNDGTYATPITPTSNYFNWVTGTPTSSKWQNVSEITQYSHWSTPLELRDINNNYTASKMGDNYSKVIASGNARYSELYYSGAEYHPVGNYTEGEVLGANYRSNEISHTGEYALKATNVSQKLFQVIGEVGTHDRDTSKDFRSGYYRVSYWMYNPNQISDVKAQNGNLYLNGVQVDETEVVQAGCWQQKNYIINLQANANVNLYVSNTKSGTFYYDDFRMHPIYASMNSYVYDQKTDDLLYILGANNLSTAFKYDKAGRLKASYTEVVDSGNDSGGFKLVQQYNYNYSNITLNTQYNEEINNCCIKGASDRDGDCVLNTNDNCPDTYNPNQSDTDNDGVGDVCDYDADNDGINDDIDNCPNIPNSNQADIDNDGIGDVCDDDSDNDGIKDNADNCPTTPNPKQTDNDNDGIGDVCDNDDDNDGILDLGDNCPLDSNPDQADDDNDGIGNVCDPIFNKPLRLSLGISNHNTNFADIIAYASGGSGHGYQYRWYVNYCIESSPGDCSVSPPSASDYSSWSSTNRWNGIYTFCQGLNGAAGKRAYYWCQVRDSEGLIKTRSGNHRTSNCGGLLDPLNQEDRN